jgi:glucose/arabinose dehydrogenase
MAFAPTGELWVLEQAGFVKHVRSDGSTHQALALAVDATGERGLLGIAFHPAYDGAGPAQDHVYLYYTTRRSSPTAPGHNQVSRFTVTGAGSATPALHSELVVRALPPEDEDGDPATGGSTNHNGGAIHFGADGKLYVAVGDHNYDNTPQSAHVSQTLTTPFGKILRLEPSGANPSDNPFFTGSTTDWAGAAWALGLRNPFTFAFQPGSSRMLINDVGEAVWEEINDGGAGANYGWSGSTAPLAEGFETPPPPWANYRDPLLAYDHTASLPSPAGCAITGGAFYPAAASFGAAYAGKYFFADFCGNWIRVFDPTRPGSPTTPDTSTGFAESVQANPVDLDVDAAGNLYYLSRGQGAVYRISFVPAQSIAVYRPSNSTFYLDRNSNGQWDGGDRSFTFGISGDRPITGDWSGSGTTKIGVYRPSNRTFYLDFNGNGKWDGPAIDRQHIFGSADDTPITGDWDGDGKFQIGVYRASNQTFYLDSNGNGAWEVGVDARHIFGISGDLPVIGDWNGDGKSDIAVYRPSVGAFYLDRDGNGQWDGATIDRRHSYGIKGDIPVVGYWSTSSTTQIGIFRPSIGYFFLDSNGNGEWDGALIDFYHGFGSSADRPLAGRWI